MAVTQRSPRRLAQPTTRALGVPSPHHLALHAPARRVPLARRALFQDRRRAVLAAGGVAAALLLVLLLHGIVAGGMRQVGRLPAQLTG